MKHCLKCQQSYDSSQRHCLIDGEILSLQDPYHLVGRVLVEKYMIEALVGVGGMGAVYLAHHIALNRRVAFKIMLPHLALNNQKMVELFEREGKLAGQLDHECIVDVKDAGRTSDGIAYIVMEWLDGTTLDEEIAADGKLSYARTAGILRQVAAALEAAHAKHVVHRDLKPSNIMLASRSNGQEVVKVLDFGLARVASDTADSPVSMLIGTPHYASPEQFQLGGQIDQRADLYSLGVTLYQMLTAELPFKAPSNREVIKKQQTQPPPPLREHRADAPPALEYLINRLLAKDPSERPQSASEVVRLFEQAIQSIDESKKETVDSLRPTTQIELPTDDKNVASNATRVPGSETLRMRAAQTAKNEPAESVAQLDRKTNLAGGETKAGFRFAFDFKGKKRQFSLLVSFGLLIVAAASAYRFLQSPRQSASEIATEAKPSGAPAVAAGEMSRPLEVLRYSLEVESRGGKKLQRADQPIATGESIRFHFIPRERGYLYILAPNQNNIPTTFLTAKPAPESGVGSNLIESGQDFRFPDGARNEGISFTKDETSMAFTIIFSPTPLSEPAFFALRAARELNGTEQNELTRLRRRLESKPIELKPSADNDSQSSVWLPATQKLDGPIMTDLMIQIVRR